MSSRSSYPSRVELGRREHHPQTREKRRDRVLFWSVLLGLAVLLVVLRVAFVDAQLDTEKLTWSTLVEMSTAIWRKDPLEASVYLLMLLSLLMNAMGVGKNSRDRLILTDQGIEFRRGAILMMPFVKRGGWRAPWVRIRKVEGRWDKLHAVTVELVLHFVDGSSAAIAPDDWVDITGPPSPRSGTEKLGGDQATSPLDSLSRTETSVVFKYLRRAGFDIDLYGTVHPQLLDVTRKAQYHKVAVFLFGAAVALLGVFASITKTEAFPEGAGRLWLVYAGVALLFTLAGFVWQRRAKVALVDAGIYAVLTGAFIGLSLYPGTLYLNSWTDAEGLKPYTYIVRPQQGLEPTVAGMPWIRDGLHRDFYLSYVGGEQYTVWLRKGGLRIWQFDNERINKALRAGESVRRHENEQGKTK